MAKQPINLGAAPNDGTGDPLRTAGTKINENFDELYASKVPAGGTPGQALVKLSAADDDFDWGDVASGGAGGGSGSRFSGGSFKTTGPTNINAVGTPYLLPWDAADEYDTDGYHDPAVNPERVTIPEDGYYVLSTTVLITAVTADQEANVLMRHRDSGGTNLGTVGSATGSASDNTNVFMSASSPPVFLSAGDYVEVELTVDTDASVNFSAASRFGIFRIPSGIGQGQPMLAARLDTVSSTASGEVPWSAPVFDDGGFWDAGQPTRLTIPAGVDRCEVHAQLAGEGETILTLAKNGSTVGLGEVGNTGGSDYTQVSSGVIDVVEGDYFTVSINIAVSGFTGSRSFSIRAWSSEGALVVSTVVEVAGAANNLEASQSSQYLRFTEAAAKSLTVRENATAALPDDGEWNIRNVGAGDLTIVAAGAVVINPPAGGSLVVPQNGTVTLKRVAVDVFDLMGSTNP